jgi:GT2 family glycosyltransferase
MTRLAIIIVSYNSRGDLENALRALTATPANVAHEIVVVDNASSDSTPAYVREHWPQVRLIASESNLGFSQANNLGIRSTSSELVLLANPDTIITAAAVDRLVAIIDSLPEVAIVGPRIVDGQGRAELSFGAMISPWAELRQKILVRGNDRGWPPITALVERMTRRARRVDWVSGACLLVRRTDLDQVGGFDPRFFMYAEDVDLCAAGRARGRAVFFAADPQVVHLRGRSGVSAPVRVRDAYRRSQIAFYAKHHPAWVPFLKVYLKILGRLPDTPT